MTVVLACVTAFLFCLLVLVAAMRPVRAQVSAFELRRRREKEEKTAQLAVRREAAEPNLRALLYAMRMLLLLGLTLASVAWFGWVVGCFVAVVAGLSHGAVARLAFTQAVGTKLYQKIEPKLLGFVERYGVYVGLLRLQPEPALPIGVFSKDELVELVRSSKGVLTADEARQVISGLEFGATLVSDVMAPREAVDTIGQAELLGPTTLDALYKTGRSYVPVIGEGIDDVVGVLFTKSLLIATSKETQTAAEAMDPEVFYIRKEQSLTQALQVFVETKSRLLIVVDTNQSTVGVLSLGRVIEALLGRKLRGGFDSHGDRAVVAKRTLDT